MSQALVHHQPGSLPSQPPAPGTPAGNLRYAWVVVGLLWVVACLNYLDRLMLVSMRESVKADIAMTEAQFGLLTSVFLWVYGAVSPLGGFVADRFGRKWVIIGSLVTWSVMTWLTGHVHSFEALFAARALMGVSEACYIPAGLALIAEWHPPSTRSLATGIHMSGLYTGAALGGLGGYMADHFGWRQGFSWFGWIGIAYALLLLAFLRGGGTAAAPGVPAPANQCRWLEAIKALFGQASFFVLLTYLSLAALAAWGITGWLPTFLREGFSLTQGQAGLSATGYVQLGSYVGVLAGGALSDVWVRTNTRARLYVVLIGFCVAGPALSLIAGSHVFAWAVAGMLLYGIGRGCSDANVMPILCQVASPRYRATGYGFLNLFSTFTGGAMIYVGGMLRDAHVSLSKVFQVSAIALVVAGVVLLAVRPSRSKEEGAAP